MLQIHDDTMFTLFGESITVHADVVGGGHLGGDAIVELHHIVTRLSILVFVRKRKCILLIYNGRVAYERGDEDVAVIRAAGTAEMGVRKAINATVAIVIARTAVPAIKTRVRAKLDGAKRQNRARVGMSVFSGAHERIHILRLRETGCNGQDRNQ